MLFHVSHIFTEGNSKHFNKSTKTVHRPESNRLIKHADFEEGNIRIRSIILAGFLLYTMFEKQAYKAFSGTRSLLMRNLEVNKLARHRKEWSLIKNDQCI
jgi:hypothetical protein